jgi:hypothetical protein
VVTWAPADPTPTSATLEPGQFPGQIDVFLNTNTSSNPRVPDHAFTNTSGMDLLKLGSLTDFTVVDKVPAARKPQHNDGPDTEEGIQVQGGTNATLVIDATGFDNDTLIQVKESSYVEVTDRSGLNTVQSLSHFGSGVTQLEIRTNDVDAAAFRAGSFTETSHSTWLPDEGTNVLVGSLPSGIHVLVDTGPTATHDNISIGNNESIIEEVTVKTGAGDDIVRLQTTGNEGGNGDDACEVLVDFAYADDLGLGNKLIVRSVGQAHLNNAPGTTDHPIYVDDVIVSGESSSDRGKLILEYQAEIDDLDVENWGILTIATDDAVVNDLFVDRSGSDHGDLIAEAEATSVPSYCVAKRFSMHPPPLQPSIRSTCVPMVRC